MKEVWKNGLNLAKYCSDFLQELLWPKLLYQPLERVFHHISKHLVSGFKKKRHRLFNPLLVVWKLDETLFLVFDVIYQTRDTVGQLFKQSLT